MGIKLSPQQSKLIELHKTGDWVCSTEIEYMRDHRKRYSELVAKGFTFEAEPCNTVCGKNHSSKVFMRRLISKVVEKNGRYFETKVSVPALF